MVKSHVLIIIAGYEIRTPDHGVRLDHRTINLHHKYLAMEMLTIALLYDLEGCYTVVFTGFRGWRGGGYREQWCVLFYIGEI